MLVPDSPVCIECRGQFACLAKGEQRGLGGPTWSLYHLASKPWGVWESKSSQSKRLDRDQRHCNAQVLLRFHQPSLMQLT
jgi:hypothetical protein